MRHASENDLSTINEFLEKLRSLPGLKEKKTGIFYRKSKAFLHFHEDKGKLFADVRLDGSEFERWPSSTKSDQIRLFNSVAKALK